MVCDTESSAGFSKRLFGTREEMSPVKFLGFLMLSKHKSPVWKEEEVETSGEAMVLEFQIETCYHVSIH